MGAWANIQKHFFKVSIVDSLKSLSKVIFVLFFYQKLFWLKHKFKPKLFIAVKVVVKKKNLSFI